MDLLTVSSHLKSCVPWNWKGSAVCSSCGADVAEAEIKLSAGVYASYSHQTYPALYICACVQCVKSEQHAHKTRQQPHWNHLILYLLTCSGQCILPAGGKTRHRSLPLHVCTTPTAPSVFFHHSSSFNWLTSTSHYIWPHSKQFDRKNKGGIILLL